MTNDDDLARLDAALTATAEQLTRRRDTSDETCPDVQWEATLVRLTAAAADQVPGATFAGLTMREPDGTLSSHAPSDPRIVELDRAQVRLGEGPCVDALRSGDSHMTLVDDFPDEHGRWPRFAALARESGIVSLVSFAMAPLDAPPGALNVYASTPKAFDSTSQAIASAFATQAAVAVYGAQRVAQLERAVASRDVIGQAKGILMERFTLDDEQSFELLVRSSQSTNIKLADVARWLTGEAVDRARTVPPDNSRGHDRGIGARRCGDPAGGADRP